MAVILSEMSKLEQLMENVKIFEAERPLDETEQAAIQKVTDSMLDILPCTACRYCVTHCPQQLQIAGAMRDFVEKLNQPAGL